MQEKFSRGLIPTKVILEMCTGFSTIFLKYGTLFFMILIFYRDLSLKLPNDKLKSNPDKQQSSVYLQRINKCFTTRT